MHNLPLYQSATLMINVRRRILSPAKARLRYLWMGGRDLFDTILRLRPELTPPRLLVRSIGGDFESAGKQFLNYFKVLADLQPTDYVLDVGCGVGRMAVPLTGYLNASGRYEGFDIMQNVVDWCSRNITPRFPNFHFRWVEIYNKEYNTRATIQACDFVFPYADATFDFVFATSVFTHMYEVDIANYMREIHRVLKPGGKCLLSWFVLTPESSGKVRDGRASLNFAHSVGSAFTAWPEIPEAAIAFPAEIVENLYLQAGFASPEWHPGNWSSAHQTGHYQDMYLARKASAN